MLSSIGKKSENIRKKSRQSFSDGKDLCFFLFGTNAEDQRLGDIGVEKVDDRTHEESSDHGADTYGSTKEKSYDDANQVGGDAAEPERRDFLSEAISAMAS